MGVFDSVKKRCRCGGTVEFQSKARGNSASLHTYKADKVPMGIAADIHEDFSQCDKCGTLHIATIRGADTVEVSIEPV